MNGLSRAGLEGWLELGALLLLLVATLFDWRQRRIPDALTLPALGLGLLASVVIGGGQGALFSILGALGAALVPLIVWRLGALGGGDVKLLAALGALLGLKTALEIQLVAYAAVLLLAALKLTWRGELWATVVRGLAAAGRSLVKPKEAGAQGAEEAPSEAADPLRARLPLAGFLLLGALAVDFGELLMPF